MMRLLRSLIRHIRGGFRNLVRNGWMSTASILTMTMTLFMIGGLFFVLVNIDNITNEIEEGIQIRTYISRDASDTQEEELKKEIEKIDHVEKVEYRSREDELTDITEQISEFEMFEGDSNPLYNVYVVTIDDLDNLDTVSKKIEQLKNVDSAVYGDVGQLLKAIETLRLVLAIISAVLIVIAVMLITNAVRSTIYARQTEIEIMRLVGATNSYIRAPFAYEGAFIGIISAVLASGLLYAAYQAAQQATVEIVGYQLVGFVPMFPTFYYVSGVLLLTGMILGIYSARRSMRKFLKI